jgi:hypothetical protein
MGKKYSKVAQKCTKVAQKCTKMAQKCNKMAQKGTKMAQKCTKMAIQIPNDQELYQNGTKNTRPISADLITKSSHWEMVNYILPFCVQCRIRMALNPKPWKTYCLFFEWHQRQSTCWVKMANLMCSWTKQRVGCSGPNMYRIMSRIYICRTCRRYVEHM